MSRVVGFKKIQFYTNENVGSGELDLPEQQMPTTSYWLTIPAHLVAMLRNAADDRRDGVVALVFAIRQVAQLLLMCDRLDIWISIDTVGQVDQTRTRGSMPALAWNKNTRLFIYDNYPIGIGFSQLLYSMHLELINATGRLIAECDCENGCPGYVGLVGNTGPLARAAALRILELLLSESSTADGAKDPD